MTEALKIQWSADNRSWDVVRHGVGRDPYFIKSFPTLHEAEQYVIERRTRRER